MIDLQALEGARRFRELARFYGEASTALSEPGKSHYKRLCEACEYEAYQLELAVVGSPVDEGGPLREENLPARTA